MQDIIDANAELDLRVHVVWSHVVGGTSPRDQVLTVGGTLTGANITHYWDDEELVGHWFSEEVGWAESGAAAGDVFYVYTGAAEDLGDGPGLIDWGGTIFDKRDELRSAISATQAS